MAMTSHVSNAEISANPDTGLVVGDANPATTQNGVMTKLRDADDENNTDIGAHKTTFDAHDHGAAGGGQPIGTGGVVAIADDGIDAAAIDAGAIQSAHVQALAVTTAKISDETVEKVQLGAPVSASKATTGSAGTKSFTFSGAGGNIPLFSVEYDHDDEGMGFSVRSVSSTGLVVEHSSITGTITVRAYGCSGVS